MTSMLHHHMVFRQLLCSCCLHVAFLLEESWQIFHSHCIFGLQQYLKKFFVEFGGHVDYTERLLISNIIEEDINAKFKG